MWAPSFPPISLPQLLPPLKPVVPKFECLGVFADDAFLGFGESFGFGGMDVHGDFEVGTATGQPVDDFFDDVVDHAHVPVRVNDDGAGVMGIR